MVGSPGSPYLILWLGCTFKHGRSFYSIFEEHKANRNILKHCISTSHNAITCYLSHYNPFTTSCTSTFKVENIIPQWSVLCMPAAGRPSMLQTLRNMFVLLCEYSQTCIEAYYAMFVTW